ncbi:MAG: hypothetical protein JRN15_07960 [Nitrososphaerota archaeon]|nr:hypothetical protein [Nitrososphaerota archaeon]
MDLTFAGIIAVGLLFLDGLIFGVAAKKGVASILLVIVGLIIAGSIGLVIPFFNLSNILAIVKGFVSSITGMFPQMVYAFPILWIIGFALGVLV